MHTDNDGNEYSTFSADLAENQHGEASPLHVLQAAQEHDPEPVEPDLVELTPGRSSLPVQKARRELKHLHRATEAALGELVRLDSRTAGAADLSAIALDSLVCAATDTSFPLDGDDRRLQMLRARAVRGELDKYAELARDELEDIIVTLVAARASLKAAYMLNEPLPHEWGNLHPVLLARKLAMLGHTLMRGRSPA